MKRLHPILQKQCIKLCFSCILLLWFGCTVAKAQISAVSMVQDLSFGAFSTGTGGGTITISASGSRSATGTVIPLNMGIQYFHAIFEVEAIAGTIIPFPDIAPVTLTGSNGGTMILKIDTSSPVMPFATSIPPPGRTQIAIGGTLSIGDVNSNPPGNYQGQLIISFHNE